ncbi:MAG: hypothetical protein M1826_005934 [Phylliscum demangeonii]|nr:MAG: hypothetical protein M1826_005934 [Phylliscum demangeonii]
MESATVNGESDDEGEKGDAASDIRVQPATHNAFNITANSIRLQLDILSQVATALQTERTHNPEVPIGNPSVSQALAAYEAATESLGGLISSLVKISRDRETYWQSRLDQEAEIRRLWEDSMARVAREQEALEGQIEESEDKRKRTKKALRDALESSARPGMENMPSDPARRATSSRENLSALPESKGHQKSGAHGAIDGPPLGPTRMEDLAGISDSESASDEFFDAVSSGEVQVVTPGQSMMIELAAAAESGGEISDSPRTELAAEIATSFKGHEAPLRTRLKLAADDRPKISLWGILKSMIGKDMTRMTLPVSFNEPTSLLQRVAEDMEYTDLIDIAVDRMDSTERMVYVAGFAASEYASTIGRVAKPFNPLLGETFEYVRPDKGYRFLVEQISHHPPVSAVFAQSSKWEYYGESAMKSKFYGKSFEFHPLGIWFLKLRPSSGGEELYTWKKVTSSVVGIITNNPTVDNYGLMEIKNWTTGEVCQLDFKQRGWRSSDAYEVKGKVMDRDGNAAWSIAGRWNDKIYARRTYDQNESMTSKPSKGLPLRSEGPGASPTFLVWAANPRPQGIPFNLTPFGLTLNDIPDCLQPYLPATDTRLRPDQRAMEDGEYDFAAKEKNRLEEKQRAKRRERETRGEEFVPRWFEKAKCSITGEEYWLFKGGYWKMRDDVVKGGKWEGPEDIF